MGYGVPATLLKPNARVQSGSGGWTINYTKDHPFITDEWGYHSGAGDTNSLGGIIKTIFEARGTKRGEEPTVVKVHADLPGYLEDDRFAGRTFME